MRAATKQTLLILFLALSLPALADAATLENASLQWGGDEVTTVNPGNPMAASLYVTLSDAADVNQVTLDYESLNPLSQSPKTFKAHKCASSGDSLICPFSNLVIQPATENPAVNITVTSHDGAEETFTHAFSFALDDTQPEVTFLGTDTCHEGTCYAQSGYTPVRIEMEDSVATFHRKWVAFSLDGTPSKVSMCEDMTCTGASTKECEDGRRVRLAIISYSGSKQSQDDAGNSLTGITETEVICDAEPPEFASNVSVSSSGALTRAEGRDRPFVAMGDTVTITVNVTERTSPTLTLVADASDLGGEEAEGTCSREDETDTWTCTVSVQATPSDLGTYDIPLRVRDLAGNTASKRDLEVDVVERQTGPADNWDMRDPTSQVANRGFLEFTPKRLFVPLALEPKDSGKQLVLDAEMTGTCVPLEKHSEEDVTYGRNGDLSFRVASVAGNNILLRGELHAGTHYYELDYLKYNCSFNVQTLRGDYLSTTEHETFTMTFKLHDSDTIGQKVMEEVEVELNDTVKRLGWVSGTRKTLSGLSAACQIPGVLKGAGGALNSVAAMLDPTPAKAASDATNEGGRILGLTSEQMRPITSVCKVLTCNLNFFEDKVLGGADLSETKIGEGFAKANLDVDKAVNPYSSLASSIITMCPTAAVYHIDRYASIDCNYAMCLSRNVRSGQATIDGCQQQRSYATCKFVWGEVWGSVPFFDFAKNSLQTMVQAVSDPVSLFGGVAISAACGSAAITKNSLAEKLCLAADNLKKMNSAVQEVKRVSDQVRILFSKQQLGREVCGPVRDHIDKASTYWDYTLDQDGFDDLYVMYDRSGNEVDDPEKAYTHCNPFSGCTHKNKVDGVEVTAFSDLSDNSILYSNGEYMGTEEGFYRAYQDSRDAFENRFETTYSDYSEVQTAYDDLLGRFFGGGGTNPPITNDVSLSVLGIEPPDFHEPRTEPVTGELEDFNGDWSINTYLNGQEYTSRLNEMSGYLDDVEARIRASEDIDSRALQAAMKDIGTLRKDIADARSQALSVQDNALKVGEDYESYARAKAATDVAPMAISRSQKYADMLREQLAGDQYESSREFIDEYAQTRANLEEEIVELEKQKQRDINRKKELESELQELETKENPTYRERARMEQLESHIESFDAVIKDTNNQIRETNRELGSNELLLKAKAVVDENWRGLSVIGSVLSTATFTNSVTNMLADKDILDIGWSKNGDSKYDKAMSRFNEQLEQGIEGATCKKKLGSGSQSLKANFDGGGTASSAAYVAGVRTREGEEDGVAQYSYSFNAMVQNAKSNEENLSFSILLKSTGGGRQAVVTLDYDHEDRPVTTLSIEPGSAEEWVKDSMIHHPGGEETTPQRFDVVCLKFHEDVRDFFDLTRDTNEFCRRLEEG